MSRNSPLDALRRRWRVALFTFLVAMGVVLVGMDIAPRQYSAAATLRLVPSPASGDTYRLDIADRLMNTFANLVTTRPIQSALQSELDVGTLPSVRVEMLANTELMRIITRHSDPKVAALAANDLASILVERSRKYQGTNTPSPLEFTVVEAAVAPKVASWPNQRVLLPIGTLVAILGALGMGLLFERLDPTVYSAARLAALTDVPILAQVPRLSASRRRKPGDGSVPFREAFRYLALAVKERIPATSAQMVLVTGCQPGDGASTIAANLATTAASRGRRVLVVDCNLRRPSLHGLFGVPNTAGLSTVLSGRVEPQEVIAATRVRGVSVLPSGPSASQDWSLVDSEAMRDLLRVLATHFDLVVLDAASMAEGADAVSLAPHTGGALLVIRRGRVHGDAAVSYLGTLESSGVDNLGLVMNR